MFFGIPAVNPADSSKGDARNRRKSGRFRCELTTCQFGPVSDLSKDGCRVSSRMSLSLPEGASVNLLIESNGLTVLVPARPVSCKRRGLFSFDIGFRFFDLSDQTRRELAQLASAAAERLAVVDRPNF